MSEKMSTQAYESLKTRLDAQKARLARSTAIIEAEKQRWKESLGTDDPAEVEAILTKTSAEIAEIDAGIEDKTTKLEALLQKMEAVK